MRAALVVITVVALGVLTGCGGGNGDSGTDSTTQKNAPSKAEFIQQGDQICKELRRKAKPFQERYSRAVERDDREAAVEVLNEEVQVAEKSLAEFRALTPPQGDEEIVARYLDAITEQIGLTRRLSDAIDASDQERVNSLADEIRRSGDRTKGLAQGYGFKTCGSGT